MNMHLWHISRQPLATLSIALLLAGAIPSLAIEANTIDSEPVSGVEADCSNVRPQVNNLYFGDLHIHTSYSMDAYIHETRTTPWDAYTFAKGGTIRLAPLNINGEPSRSRKLPAGKTLDFAAVTDHSEYLGEVSLCTDPSLAPANYNSSACLSFREEGKFRQFRYSYPDRLPEICDDDGRACEEAGSTVWQDTIAAANANNAPCEFTTFIAYEWSGTVASANLHRNVIFRSDQVPVQPHSAFVSDDPQELRDVIDLDCPAGSGCEALIIPHNTNLSQGLSMRIKYPEDATIDQQRILAAQRERLERLLEITQHKGSSECLTLYSNDEQCDFELSELQMVMCDQRPPAPEGTCLAEIDTFRGALKVGLQERARIGINPIKLGAMASTDNHNGTAGDVAENGFKGHGGAKDATPYLRLSGGSVSNSPGGLIAVWAPQNTREAIFGAMYRRETYATSGPRMAVRFFAGPYLQQSDCEASSSALVGYKKGVPMGGELKDGELSRINFLVDVLADEVAIDRIQIIKGYLDSDGAVHEVILEDDTLRHVIGEQTPPSCDEEGVNCDPLCGVIQDVGFEPDQLAYYYLRVLEYPTPRWSSYDCEYSPRTAELAACNSVHKQAPKFIQERAWTSPIWYEPPI